MMKPPKAPGEAVSRPESASAPLRWLRALFLATVALLAGSLAHVTARGELPGATAMAALLALGTTVAAPLLRNRASTCRVALLLVLGQTVVHALLTAASGHHHDGMPEPGLTGPPLWLHHLVEDLTPTHLAMAVAHAAAAAVVGLWLARGEHALWLLVALAGQAVVDWIRPPRTLAVTIPPRVVPVDHALLPPVAHAFSACLRRRGPPAPCAS
jgi:hypothetical protein